MYASQSSSPTPHSLRAPPPPTHTLYSNRLTGSNDGFAFFADFLLPSSVATLASGTIGIIDALGTASALRLYSCAAESLTPTTSPTLSFGATPSASPSLSASITPSATRTPSSTASLAGCFISVFAGSTSSGAVDGVGTNALFNAPSKVASVYGDTLYVADTGNHKLRKVQAGVVTTFAGLGTSGAVDGAGAVASFYAPRGLAVDDSGSVWVADTGNHKIRFVTPAGVVTTLAGSGSAGLVDGLGTNARLRGPVGIAVSGWGVGARAFFSDGNHLIRSVDATGLVVVVAGNSAPLFLDGSGRAAAFSFPSGIVLSRDNATLYVADSANHLIRAVTIPGSIVSTFSGGGFGTALSDGPPATFSSPIDVSLSPTGDVFVADAGNFALRALSAAGATRTLAGTGAPGTVSSWALLSTFSALSGVSVTQTGDAFITDGNALRLFSCAGSASATPTPMPSPGSTPPATPSVTPSFTPTQTPSATPTSSGVGCFISAFAGNYAGVGFSDAQGTNALFNQIYGVAAATDASGSLYVADRGNQKIRLITSSGAVTTFAGSGGNGHADNANKLLATFSSPSYLWVDAAQNVYVTDNGNNAIRLISAAGVTTVVGSPNNTLGFRDGFGTNALLYYPAGLTGDDAGNLYLAGNYDNRIRKITIATKLIQTIGGTGAAGSVDNVVGTSATFYYPQGITIAPDLSRLFIADTNSHKIRVLILSTTSVGTLAGSGAAGFKDDVGIAAIFNQPNSPFLDGTGLFVSDGNNNKIRRVNIVTGAVTTAVGNGIPGANDGFLTQATLKQPRSVTILPASLGGVMYVGDGNNAIRRVICPSASPTPTPSPSLSPGASVTRTPVGTVSPTPTPLATPSSSSTGVNGCIQTSFVGSGTAGSLDGVALAAQVNNPAGLIPSTTGDRLFVCDRGSHKIRVINIATATISLVAGSGTGTWADGTGATASFNTPHAVTTNPTGNIYVADTFSHRIRKITPLGVVTTIGGTGTATYSDGTGTSASFWYPEGITCNSGNTRVFVSDTYNNKIRMIDLTSGVVTSLSGQTSTTGLYADGVGTNALWWWPREILLSTDETTIYVADESNQLLRSVSVAGWSSTIAGRRGVAAWRDGVGASSAGLAAGFNSPWSLALDPAGGRLAIIGKASATLQIMSLTDFSVTTISGTGVSGTSGVGPFSALSAAMNLPNGVAFIGSNIYYSDSSSHRIRLLTCPSASVSPTPTAAVTLGVTPSVSPSATASFTATTTPTPSPTASSNDCIVSTAAGSGVAGFADGLGTNAQFNDAVGVAVDWSSRNVYVTERAGARVRLVSPTNAVSTVAGNGVSAFADGIGTNAAVSSPVGIAVLTSGDVVVCDSGNHKIRLISNATGAVTTMFGSVAGAADGVGTSAQLTTPLAVALDEANSRIFFTSAHTIRGASLTSRASYTLAGVPIPGYADGANVGAALANPRALVWSTVYNSLYFLDDSKQLRALTSDIVRSYAGSTSGTGTDGIGVNGGLTAPAWGLAVDSAGRVLVGDSASNAVRVVALSDPASVYGTLAGSPARSAGYVDGPAASSAFSNPRGIALAPNNALYVVDGGNNRLRLVTCAAALGPATPSPSPSYGGGSASVTPTPTASASSTVTPPYSGCSVQTVAGSGATSYQDGVNQTAGFNNPYGLTFDVSLTALYVADNANVRLVNLTTGIVSTAAGSQLIGWLDHNDPLQARFNFVQSLALARKTTNILYIADPYNHKARMGGRTPSSASRPWRKTHLPSPQLYFVCRSGHFCPRNWAGALSL